MIGVFDSGFGGLTVHRALVEALPDEDFVYLGDNKNAPYGTRPPLEVLNLTCAGIDRLFDAGCTLVVIACNTASVIALRWIQQQWLPTRVKKDGISRNVLGVVVPTVEAATGFLWSDVDARKTSESIHTIAVFGTPRTVESGIYPIEISKRRPDIRVIQQACPELAAAIENGAAHDVLRTMISRYVQALPEKPDSVILGCTHYPLVLDVFAEMLPPGTPIISQAKATAEALTRYIPRHPEYSTSKGSGKRLFLSTGHKAEALPLIEKFWGGKMDFKQA